jgi:DNA ligase-1
MLMLAKKYNEDKLDHLTKFVYITEKIDGVRAYFNGKDFVKRSGKIVTGLPQSLIDEARTIYRLTGEYCLDGELVYDDPSIKNCIELRKKTAGEVNSKRENKKLTYIIFDLIDTKSNYNIRLSELEIHFKKHEYKNIEHIQSMMVSLKILPKTISKLMPHYLKQGKEGIMINSNTPYEGKRTKNLLKVKNENEVYLEITGTYEGEGKYTGMIGGLIVDFNGNEVRVGSGLTDELRAMPTEDFIGKILTVKYQEATEQSLIHPVYVEIVGE